MAKRRKSKIVPIPLVIGNDPSLWRFASAQEALRANTDLLAGLIQAGQALRQTGEPKFDEGQPGDTATLEIAAR